MDSRIYVITHKEFTMPSDSLYVPLQVGVAANRDLGFLRDNTGENISNKNENYCELTGLYWIWKNVNCDVAGLCHYRRYFLRDYKMLTRNAVETIMQDYDIILPNSSFTDKGNLFNQFKSYHNISNILECGTIIKEKYPADYHAFLWCMNCNFMSVGNMIIAKKKILDAYCSWLFDILFEFEKRMNIKDYDEYQKRMMGFLSERLLRVWMINHNYKVYENQIGMVDEDLNFTAY